MIQKICLQKSVNIVICYINYFTLFLHIWKMSNTYEEGAKQMDSRGFSAGVKSGSSIAIGYFPIALTFGLLAKTTGLSLIEATAMSIFVFAGAAQYISLSLIAAGVAPILIV